MALASDPALRGVSGSVTLDPAGILAEADQRIGRATQALPNGYCGLPVQPSCPHANACLSFSIFTTPEFLLQHHQQRRQVPTDHLRR
ncbi:hypothetical protein [Nonomuraea phyllanthi]|uniref:hypothetical protein n=1 Tax=Nonomuraea phyllanthi TaxID=2219224 RepID=UPI001D13BED5|nr:hypothetical protein [Nonomuraea phyllanthi]